MQTKQILHKNRDLTHCPITSCPIRHPIYTSDGKHYELKDLHEWLSIENISPTKKAPITFVIYDSMLKESLDNLLLPERKEDYDKEIYLKKIHSLIQPPRNLENQIAYKLKATFSSLLIVSLIFDVLSDDSSSLYPTILLTFLVSLGDYLIRTNTGDKYNLLNILNIFTNNKLAQTDTSSFANEIIVDYNFK